MENNSEYFTNLKNFIEKKRENIIEENEFLEKFDLEYINKLEQENKKFKKENKYLKEKLEYQEVSIQSIVKQAGAFKKIINQLQNDKKTETPKCENSSNI